MRTRSSIVILVSTIFTAMCICSVAAFGGDPIEKARKIMLASTIGPIDAGIVGSADHHQGFRQGQIRRTAFLPKLSGRKETITIFEIVEQEVVK